MTLLDLKVEMRASHFPEVKMHPDGLVDAGRNKVKQLRKVEGRGTEIAQLCERQMAQQERVGHANFWVLLLSSGLQIVNYSRYGRNNKKMLSLRATSTVTEVTVQC